MKDSVRGLLATNIKKYREAIGLSQMQLGELAGISTSLVASIETGAKFPSSTSLFKISKAFNIEVYQLFLPESESQQSQIDSYRRLGQLKRQLQSDLKNAIDSRFQDFVTGKD